MISSKSRGLMGGRATMAVVMLSVGGVLAGCSGNGSNGGPNTLNLPGGNVNATATPVPNRFAGTFTGTFNGATGGGNPVAGSFVAMADAQGRIMATVTQNGSSFAGSGSVSDDGTLMLTAGTGPAGFTSTLSGNIVLRGGDAVAQGTLNTTQNGQTVVTGQFLAIRAQAAANPFAGNYNFAFRRTGTGNGLSEGTFTINFDRNGSNTGTATRDGIGIIERSGRVTVITSFALINTTFPPGNSGIGSRTVVIGANRFNGQASITGGVATATGTFTTTLDGQPDSIGTFTATRTGA